MTRFKRGQGSCSFQCCDEDGIPPGSPYILMTPAEIPFSIQLLKIQEPCCPPFQVVSLLCIPCDIPSSSQHLKLQEPCPRGQGSCIFNCGGEEGTPPGSPYIQMTRVEIPFSIQLLKIQEPCCPPFHMLSLFMRPLVKSPLHHHS